jgi:hypothetical protein
MKVEEFLARVGRVRHHPGGWNACCPEHDERYPRPPIALGGDGDDGRTVPCCRALSPLDILAASRREHPGTRRPS